MRADVQSPVPNAYGNLEEAVDPTIDACSDVEERRFSAVKACARWRAL